MEIPNEIMKKILKYQAFSPHPVAVIFKEAVKDKLDELYEFSDSENEYCLGDEVSFANYYFHDNETWGLTANAWRIYTYTGMDFNYQSTLFDYNRRHTTLIGLSDDEDV